jgi:protein tyrosine/serine phosphatase
MARAQKALLLAVAGLLAACGGQSADAASAGEDAVQAVAKQIGATVVDPGIYRSKRPTQADLAALKAAGVKYVLDLENDQAAVNTEQGWAKALNLTFVSEQMSGFWTPDDKQVDRIEAWLADPKHRPVLVHCLHGEDRTGLIIGLHRVFHDGWTPAKAYQEMLANGFHQLLVFLNHYYEEKTGWDD